MLRQSTLHQPGLSIPIARILGVSLRLHASFLLLPALVVVAALSHEQSVAGTLVFLGWVVVCILLHEVGHAVVAMRLGARVPRLTLYPTGGIAWFAKVPSPRDELKIAVAGPLVNLAIACGISLTLLGWTGPAGLTRAATFEPTGYGLAAALLWINLSLAAFNLIPAYPMDGGRLLRATLALCCEPGRATSVAAAIGTGLAVALTVTAVVTWNAWLAVLAAAVFIGARQQLRAEHPPETVARRWAGEAMVREFATLAPHHLLTEAACRAAASAQQEFPVVGQDGRLCGVLTRPAIFQGVHRHGPRGRVGDEMDAAVTVIGPRSNLYDVLTRAEAHTGRPVLVVENGRVIGMIPADRVREFAELGELGVRNVTAGTSARVVSSTAARSSGRPGSLDSHP
jgi:Zn-dependent protease/CBS domain-containing protein